ncbi:MAG: cellulose synthase/poly-beta-1,6-N-acetylglucosamine synthase-like glycosyltransferase [Saprospiraceae bacterium]|jgi:cellulose synthase/poly-beta-1,6-N-acetylglucosamine synthase-like glycosyltransferase
MLFWGCSSIVFYTYLGYGIILFLLVKLKAIFIKEHPKFESPFLPKVTLFVAAYNEISCIKEKVKNMFEIDYPADRLQILFITDGSNDGSPEYLESIKGVEVLHENTRGGKIGAINRGMGYVKHPIVIYSDANAMLNPQSVKEIVKHYEDPIIGCVAGEKRVFSNGDDGASGAGEGIYWKYESFLKKYDFKLYSAVGAAGELFSIRTELHQIVEKDTILDDFIISLRIAMKGYKIAYEPAAFASEYASESIQEEKKRKVRISAGGIQSTVRLLKLFNPFKYGWLTFQFVSHRVLRWTVSPVFLFLVFPLNLVLALESDLYFYWILFYCQILFYLSAGIGYFLQKNQLKYKIFFVPFYFVFMNVCVFLGISRYLNGNQSVLWEKARK